MKDSGHGLDFCQRAVSSDTAMRGNITSHRSTSERKKSQEIWMYTMSSHSKIPQKGPALLKEGLVQEIRMNLTAQGDCFHLHTHFKITHQGKAS